MPRNRCQIALMTDIGLKGLNYHVFKGTDVQWLFYIAERYQIDAKSLMKVFYGQDVEIFFPGTALIMVLNPGEQHVRSKTSAHAFGAKRDLGVCVAEQIGRGEMNMVFIQIFLQHEIHGTGGVAFDKWDSHKFLKINFGTREMPGFASEVLVQETFGDYKAERIFAERAERQIIAVTGIYTQKEINVALPEIFLQNNGIIHKKTDFHVGKGAAVFGHDQGKNDLSAGRADSHGKASLDSTGMLC